MDTKQENSHAYPCTYEGVVQILERLRGPDGCPWDLEQTHQSMTGMLLEECYELIEAIEQGDVAKMVEELGDVLFHVAFQVRIADEADEFSHGDVFGALLNKLVRRHPHVFGNVQAADADAVKINWEVIKEGERSGTDTSALDGVPRSMPSLAYAQSVQERAARVGFDWDDYKGALAKVTEELIELEQARSKEEREAELGDVLFSIVNVARWLDADAEAGLRHTNAKFHARYSTMERLSRERGTTLPALTMSEKESLWQEAKTLQG